MGSLEKIKLLFASYSSLHLTRIARHESSITRLRLTTPESSFGFPSPSPPFLTPTRDCFSFLPHEIIQTILDMAKDENLALPLANRSLLPFYRAELYREV